MNEPTEFYLDSETKAAPEQFAVVYAPRTQRGRFQANCVQIFPDEASARQAADASKHLIAARVVGPSKSSEGFMMYYLVRWL